MRSIEILHYNPEAKSLSFRARDATPNFMTCVTILDDDTYLGAENSCNLLTVQKNSDSATDEERSHLAVRLLPLEQGSGVRDGDVCRV